MYYKYTGGDLYVLSLRMVRPILAYAAETRQDIAKTWQVLETAEMKTLRRILDLTLFDKQRSGRHQGKMWNPKE